jgi:hypothetical protein
MVKLQISNLLLRVRFSHSAPEQSRESVLVARESHKLSDGRFDSSSRNHFKYFLI